MRYRTAETWVDRYGASFRPLHHYFVGGNTKVYGAALLRMRERDFGLVRHADGISPAWPLAYLDFEPWYSEAETLYSVHGRAGADPLEPPRTGPYPHTAVSHEPRIEMLSAELGELGLTPFPLPLGIRLDEADPAHSPCIRCGTCGGFPCRVGAKADAEVTCVDPALVHPNVTLRTRARVIRLHTGRGGRAVDQVVVQRDGRREEYEADVVVVACGAVNSAALLLASADDHHPAGLGNRSGVIGRHLMLHTNSSLIAAAPEPHTTTFAKTLGIHDFYEHDGSIQTLGRSDACTIALAAPDLPDPTELAGRALDFLLMTEDLPRWENRVEVGPDSRIHLRYRHTNVRAHDRLRARAHRVLSAVGCQPRVERPLSLADVTHQCGTVRFGTDPNQSALDVNCRLHDLDNVYVVDASFFPSSSAVNPALTVMANALRVADHLADRLRS